MTLLIVNDVEMTIKFLTTKIDWKNMAFPGFLQPTMQMRPRRSSGIRRSISFSAISRCREKMEFL